MADEVYVAGIFTGSIQLGSQTLTATGSSSFYVARRNRATNSFVWAVQANGTGSLTGLQLAVSGGNVFVAGSYKDNLTIGSTVLSGGYYYRGFVAKIADAGSTADWVWAQGFGSTYEEYVNALAVSGSKIFVGGRFGLSGPGANGIISTATFGSISLNNDGFTSVGYLAQLTDLGNTQTWTWATKMGRFGAAYGLTVTGNALFVTGTLSGAATFGNTTLVDHPYLSGYVAKLTNLGGTPAWAWATQVGTTGETSSLVGVVVSGTTVYAVGTFDFGTLTVGSTTLINAGGIGNSTDILVAKLVDAGGTAIWGWSASMGSRYSDTTTPLVAVSGSKVYVASALGDQRTPSVISNVAFGTTTVQTAGGSDAFIARFSDNGPTNNLDWVIQAGSSLNDNVSGLLLNQGNLCLAGTANGPATFNSTTITGGFLATLADPALPTRATTTLPGLALFPSPAHDAATVRVPAGVGPATVQVLDALGRVLQSAQAPAGQDYRLALAGLAPGVYGVRVQLGQATAVQRLVVE